MIVIFCCRIHVFLHFIAKTSTPAPVCLFIFCKLRHFMVMHIIVRNYYAFYKLLHYFCCHVAQSLPKSYDCKLLHDIMCACLCYALLQWEISDDDDPDCACLLQRSSLVYISTNLCHTFSCGWLWNSITPLGVKSKADVAVSHIPNGVTCRKLQIVVEPSWRAINVEQM